MGYQFRDPIHGLIEVSDNEAKIIAHPVFQRLRYIRQLGTSYLVYHGAEHTRFGHSIGVMHLMGSAINSLRKRGFLDAFSEKEFNRIKQIGRLVGLLHDLGHGPFSHVGEEEGGIYPQLTDVDGQLRMGHEVYTRLIVRDKLGALIDELFSSDNISCQDILLFLLGSVSDQRLQFLKDLISSQLDADRMDYLFRDTYYCGVAYGKYDLPRILDTLCICPVNGDERNPWQLGVGSDGIHAVEEFVLARYWMFIQVYFHKTRRIYDYYLRHYIKYLLDSKGLQAYPVDLDSYLEWTDSMVLVSLEHHGKASSNPWSNALYRRAHIKEAFVSTPHPEDDETTANKELSKIAHVIRILHEQYPEVRDADSKDIYLDQAKTSTSKYLIDISLYVDETDAEEPLKGLAIPVRNKHTGRVAPIQDFSLLIKSLTGKKVNILRVYATSDKLTQVRECCLSAYDGYDDYQRQLSNREQAIEQEKARIEREKADFNNIKNTIK